VEREFRGKNLSIHFRNPDGKCKGVSTLTINGEKLDSALIPLDKMKKENEVEVVL
jgi:cellobiose phosphorylase